MVYDPVVDDAEIAIDGITPESDIDDPASEGLVSFSLLLCIVLVLQIFLL